MGDMVCSRPLRHHRLFLPGSEERRQPQKANEHQLKRRQRSFAFVQSSLWVLVLDLCCTMVPWCRKPGRRRQPALRYGGRGRGHAGAPDPRSPPTALRPRSLGLRFRARQWAAGAAGSAEPLGTGATRGTRAASGRAQPIFWFRPRVEWATLFKAERRVADVG
eukprot:COSAG04_NODE_1891_length_5294_cov_3.885659_5_plen_163_part_00